MLSRFNPRHARAIGIDVGRRSARLVQLDGDGPARVAQSSIRGEHRGEDPAFVEAAAEAIRRGLDSAEFAGRSAVVALPAAVLRLKSLRLPDMPADEIAEAIKWESDGSEDDAADTLRQHVTLGQVRQGDEVRQEVLMMSARRAWVESLADALDGLRLDLRSLSVGAAGLTRAMPDDDEPRLVVDLGADSTRAMIVQRGALRFFKVIGPGQIELDRLVAERLRVPLGDAAEARRQADRDSTAARSIQDAVRTPLEELARELSLCVRYFCVSFRGTRPEAGCIVGGGASYPQLVADLDQLSDVTLRAYDPFAALTLDAPSIEQPWAWAAAVGLATDPAASTPAECDASDANHREAA